MRTGLGECRGRGTHSHVNISPNDSIAVANAGNILWGRLDRKGLLVSTKLWSNNFNYI